VTDVMNDEKAVVELDAAQPQPAVASDELVRQLAERAEPRDCGSPVRVGCCRS
jgi:hypothetical protein